MDDVDLLVQELVANGYPAGMAASAITRAFVAGARSTQSSSNAERQAAYRARKKGESERNERCNVVTPVTDSSLSLKNLDSKEEKKEKRERGVRLPDDWQPSPTDLAFTAEKGMPAAVVPREVEKFRLHWHGKHGPTAIKTLDRGWPAAWKTWVIRACEWAGYSPGTGPPKPVLPEAEIHRLEEWHRRKLEKSL